MMHKKLKLLGWIGIVAAGVLLSCDDEASTIAESPVSPQVPLVSPQGYAVADDMSQLQAMLAAPLSKRKGKPVQPHQVTVTHIEYSETPEAAAAFIYGTSPVGPFAFLKLLHITPGYQVILTEQGVEIIPGAPEGTAGNPPVHLYECVGDCGYENDGYYYGPTPCLTCCKWKLVLDPSLNPGYPAVGKWACACNLRATPKVGGGRGVDRPTEEGTMTPPPPLEAVCMIELR